ncbi:uncharacterized protein BXZ73DRAFT_80488 [Epithele typhae]|uniref:uncharacterized protein n=1 Tax=Epithele typhae TaxID=378194 RepID=UPI002007D1D3|nr:uncharacterized protein BXZ73DRAFT_80488 [Epithele typhae]KAH9918708.1 hypothetical protein BXZ73DRAFT_80488 [Epithele typhae]
MQTIHRAMQELRFEEMKERFFPGPDPPENIESEFDYMHISWLATPKSEQEVNVQIAKIASSVFREAVKERAPGLVPLVALDTSTKFLPDGKGPRAVYQRTCPDVSIYFNDKRTRELLVADTDKRGDSISDIEGDEMEPVAEEEDDDEDDDDNNEDNNEDDEDEDNNSSSNSNSNSNSEESDEELSEDGANASEERGVVPEELRDEEYHAIRPEDYATPDRRDGVVPVAPLTRAQAMKGFDGRTSYADIIIPVEVKINSTKSAFKFDLSESPGAKSPTLPRAVTKKRAKNASDSEEEHGVVAVGLAPSSGQMDSLGQITEYCAAILGRQHRTHLFAVYVLRNQARILVVTRGGSFLSAAFRYGTVEDKTLHRFFWRVAHMSREALGFDPSVVRATSTDEEKLLNFAKRTMNSGDPRRALLLHTLGRNPRARVQPYEATITQWPLHRTTIGGNAPPHFTDPHLAFFMLSAWSSPHNNMRNMIQSHYAVCIRHPGNNVYHGVRQKFTNMRLGASDPWVYPVDNTDMDAVLENIAKLTYDHLSPIDLKIYKRIYTKATDVPVEPLEEPGPLAEYEPLRKIFERYSDKKNWKKKNWKKTTDLFTRARLITMHENNYVSCVVHAPEEKPSNKSGPAKKKQKRA